MAKPNTTSPKESRVKRTPAKKGAAISVADFLKLKQPKGDLLLDVEGQTVSLTSLERIYWPDEKLTKFDLLCYYLQVSDQLYDVAETGDGTVATLGSGENIRVFPCDFCGSIDRVRDLALSRAPRQLTSKERQDFLAAAG